MAVSRAKKHCTLIIKSLADFEKLKRHKAQERRSLLGFYLDNLPPLYLEELKEEGEEGDLIIPEFDPRYQPPVYEATKNKKAKKK